MTQVTRLKVTDWLAFIEFNFLFKLSGKTQVKLVDRRKRTVSECCLNFALSYTWQLKEYYLIQ